MEGRREVNQIEAKKPVGQAWVSSWDSVQPPSWSAYGLASGFLQHSHFQGPEDYSVFLPPLHCLSSLCLPSICPPPHPSRILSWRQNTSVPVALPSPSAVFQEGRPITANTFRKPTERQDLISHQPSSCNNFQQLGFELNQWPAPKWKGPNTIKTPQIQPPALPPTSPVQEHSQMNILHMFTPGPLPWSSFSGSFAPTTF